MAHTARAVGVLVAVLFLVCVGLLNLDPLPVGAKLVGGHQCQAGTNTLPHLGPVVGDGDCAVRIDTDKHIGVIYPAPRHGGGTVLCLG